MKVIRNLSESGVSAQEYLGTTLDIKSWREHMKRTGEMLFVFMDGFDITARTWRADTVLQCAWCYKLDEKGQRYIGEDGKTATEMVTGLLEIVPVTCNGVDHD